MDWLEHRFSMEDSSQVMNKEFRESKSKKETEIHKARFCVWHMSNQSLKILRARSDGSPDESGSALKDIPVASA